METLWDPKQSGGFFAHYHDYHFDIEIQIAKFIKTYPFVLIFIMAWIEKEKLSSQLSNDNTLSSIFWYRMIRRVYFN